MKDLMASLRGGRSATVRIFEAIPSEEKIEQQRPSMSEATTFSRRDVQLNPVLLVLIVLLVLESTVDGEIIESSCGCSMER